MSPPVQSAPATNAACLLSSPIPKPLLLLTGFLNKQNACKWQLINNSKHSHSAYYVSDAILST